MLTDIIVRANIDETKDGASTEILYYVVSTFFELFNEGIVYPYVANEATLRTTMGDNTMNTDRQFNMKASVKLPQVNPETGKKEGVKYNANIIIDWAGCTEDDVYWFANRQFKIRAGTALQADGKPFEEGKVYKAKDYLPGQRVYVKKEMTPEELLAAVLANPELLAKIKNAG